MRANRGPYRFLLRGWDKISDLDLAVRVLDTEFFKTELEPLPLPIEKLSPSLVIAPHQDDETIGAGGTLLLARNSNIRTNVLYLTDGAPQSGTVEYADDVKEAVAIRTREAQEVCSRLNAQVFDLGLSNADLRPRMRHAVVIADLISDLRPKVVLAPWILDSPAKHRAANHLLWAANRVKSLPHFEVWGYQVHNSLYPNGYVDITPVLEEKRQLLDCFVSQNRFSAPYDHLSIAMAAWNSRILRGPERRYLELFFAVPSGEFFRLVEQFYFKDLSTTYRGHTHVLPGMIDFHKEITSGAGV